jgi:prephenate dehydrogenase
MKHHQKVAIIGLGVIGGSLGMVLSATGKYHVLGIDQDLRTLEVAREIGAISEGTSDCCAGVDGADIVVFAVPVGEIIKIADQIKGCISPQTVVTDVGSTKEQVVAVLEDLFPACFVGGHPMTGSEYSGIRGADQYLFENAIYVLTPTEHTDRLALQRIEELVNATGARILYLSPKEHDLIVAAVSHLPHLLAVTLMNLVTDFAVDYPQTLLLAAGGFRDVTRIAASSDVMWRDIYATNRSNLLEISRRFRESLLELERYLRQKDFDSLVDKMQQSRREREKIPLKMKGFLPALYEVIVSVPDRPGSIAYLSSILGDHGINIVDLEILRVREGVGGTIRLAFKTDTDAENALCALRENKVIAMRR